MPYDGPQLPPGVKVLSVAELTATVQALLEEAFPYVWVSGEISNLSRPASGHIYLTLKDNQAQLKAVIWRSTANRLRFKPTDGLQVIARGRIGVYPQRGEYQLIVDELQPKGIGALELAFRQLREKLEKRGFFALERKKPLPRIPRRIGLVTSPVGAAIRDLLQIITRRWPAVEICICPVRVQGEGAAEDIAAAIRLLNQLRHVDVMIVGRGGGSLEDLWAFNEEIVAQAVFDSHIPIISAVGHEVDVTIADLVADRRAATPSEAAEIVVPNHVEILSDLDATANRLKRRLTGYLDLARSELNALAQRRVLRQPLERVRDVERQLDEWSSRSQRAMRRCLTQAEQRLHHDARRLEALSPLNVLGRGYSLTWREGVQELLRSSDDVRAGARIVTRLGRGELVSLVEEVREGELVR